METRCFRPGLDLRAEPASPTNSINGIEDGVCSEGQGVQPRGAAGGPEPTSRVSFWIQPRGEVGVVQKTATWRNLPQGVRGAEDAGPGAGKGKSRAEATPGLAVPPTIELPQRRRQRPRRLFPEACHLLPPELQLHRNATRGTTLLGETSRATDAGWATNQRLLGKVARPSLFEGRSTGTIAVRAAGVLSQGGPGGRDKVAAVGARAARENEADEQADSG